MTRQKFARLNKKQKKNAVLRSGIYLADKTSLLFKTMLYQVDNFYVEVFFFKWSKNVAGFRSFCKTSKLEPYLKKIDLSCLINTIQLKTT